MKLATCAALMGVLPESTDSLKTSYLSRENTYRLVIVDFEAEKVRYALITLCRQSYILGQDVTCLARHSGSESN